ncbi:MAG: ABC transporter permease [Terracidiphilus sp.]|jgi:predicted permease
MLADLKNAFWQLRRSPGFALTAILTLALGIGATTAIFTLVHEVLLKSLPVADPARLWRIGDNEQCCHNSGLPDYTDKANDWSLFSYLQYAQFRDHTNGMESLAAFEASDTEMAVRRAGSGDQAQPFYTEFVSGNSFQTLGLRAYAGRLLQPGDDVTGATPVAVMSFQMWDQQLGRDPSAIGSSYLINGQPVTVVGIAPPGFYSERLSPTPPAFWLPLHLVPTVTPRDADVLERGDHQWLNLIGRIAPGASVAAVQSQMQVELLQFLKSPLSRITGREEDLIPLQYLRLTPGGGGVQRMQAQYQGDLHLLMWISSFVLLIACANLANLMLARSVTQRQQIAVRAALGARRSRLVQSALVECVVLAMVGGVAGVLVAWGGAMVIIHMAFQQNPISVTASPSPVVLGFAFALSLLTGLLFGVAPAWMAAHADPIQALRGANRSTGRHTTLAQKGLVVAQTAVSVVLLCAAGYLILSLQKLENQHFGFETAHRTIIRFNAQTAGLQPEQLDNFYRRLDTALSSLPSVKSVAWSMWSPMDGNNFSTDVYIAGQPTPPPGSSVNLASWIRVSPRYFATVGTKILQGRAFTDSDNRTAPYAAIVDEAFVKRYLHGENPIGAHFGDADPSSTGLFTIVGVVEDAQYWPPNDPQQASRPMYFVPAAQWPQVAATIPNADVYTKFVANNHYMASLEIETRDAAPDLEEQVRNALAGINSNLMITRFQSFGAQVNMGFSQQNMIVQLTSLFGLVALALAAIGLYGVTAYAVAQRTTEIAIRMALGANRVHVQGMVLRGAFLQVGLGLLIGVPAAIEAGRLMAAELFGVSAWSPLVLGTTTLVLAGVALIAAVAPAHRAAGVEPMEALRGE